MFHPERDAGLTRAPSLGVSIAPRSFAHRLLGDPGSFLSGQGATAGGPSSASGLPKRRLVALSRSLRPEDG